MAKSTAMHVAYLPVRIQYGEAHLNSYWPVNSIENSVELIGYRNLATARSVASDNEPLIAEVLIYGTYVEYASGYRFKNYRILQFVAFKCDVARCSQPVETVMQDFNAYGADAFLCESHGNAVLRRQPLATVVAFMDPLEDGYRTLKLPDYEEENYLKLNAPMRAVGGRYWFIPTELAGQKHEEAIYASNVTATKRLKKFRRVADDPSIKPRLVRKVSSIEISAQLSPSPERELNMLRRQRAADKTRIRTLLKALRWKETLLKKREGQMAEVGVRIDESERSYSEDKL